MCEMFKLGFALLFVVLCTCNCNSSSEELNEAQIGDTFEHETVNVEDAEIPREGSLENHEDRDEYSMEDNIDEFGDAVDNENNANMNENEGKEGETMSTNDPAEIDTDGKGDEIEEGHGKDDYFKGGYYYSESKNLVSFIVIALTEKQWKSPVVSILVGGPVERARSCPIVVQGRW